ncbi:LuxR C-terminal-related transcriptional regulator [Streptomyces sp. NPDC086783]|uniref:helix-turn-helix transcriptional regulator n=1 Tax=Streptomyces sp. NPDC086783 TaxID=3365758 RepID=UPI003805D519
MRDGEPINEAVASLTRADTLRRIPVNTFSEGETGTVLHRALGQPVGRLSLRKLHRVSAGNALYLRELTLSALRNKSLVNDGEIWEIIGDQTVKTSRLTELVQARLNATDPAAKPILDLLALCENVSLSTVHEMASPEVLESLESAGLLQIDSDKRRVTVRLAHPLHGEILRANIPTLRRRTILLREAERIESIGSRRRDDTLHIASYRLAATGTAPAALLKRAASLARASHDYPQVVILLNALLADEHTASTLLVLGETFFQMGRWSEAEETLVRAGNVSSCEADRLAVALVRTSNLLYGNGLTKALSINADASSSATEASSKHMLRINEGFLRIAAGQPIEGLNCLHDLEDDPADASDINAWLRGAFLRPVALALTGQTARAVTCANQAYSIHQRVDERALVSHPAVEILPMVLALTEAGRLAEAIDAGEGAYTQMSSSGRLVQVGLAMFLGRAQWMAGRPVAARRWWAEASALARVINYDAALRMSLNGIAACAAVLGDLPAGEAALAEFRTVEGKFSVAVSSGEELLGEAWMQAATGRVSGARSLLMQAADQARISGHITSESFLLAEVARLGGSKYVHMRLTDLSNQCDGKFAPTRARFAVALASEDPKALMGSARELEAINATLLAAEAATAAAAAWKRSGHAGQAGAASRQALVFSGQCEGARTPLLAIGQSAASLSGREREIAFMAASGTQSKEIALTLGLSVRTVNNHLQRAYTKLGVTTRRDLGTILNGG